MSDVDLEDFLDKWRGRWPEWRIAQVFLPEAQAPLAEAWFALVQEWTDAAWAGADPTPGFAKLGWWQEELQGWARGGRRHPLGRVLQRQPAPWAALAMALPALQTVREPLRAWAEPSTMVDALQPIAAVIDACERALFADPGRTTATAQNTRNAAVDARGDAFALLAAHALWSRDETDAAASVRDWAGRLSVLRPVRAETRPRRIHDAYAHARLRRIAGGAAPGALPPLSALWRAWRAARG